MRVVSLLPAATDIVVALGAAKSLVAVTHECDAPAARGRPRVTSSAVDAWAAPGIVDSQVREASLAGVSLFRIDEAAIRAARPDLVLTQAVCDVCAVSEGDVRALAARLTPSPRVVTLSATKLDDVLADIALVADAMGDVEGGTRLVDDLRSRMRLVHDTLEAARAPRPRVVVIEWTDPAYVAGHWVPEMVRRAGGVDVLAEAGAHSVTVDPAAVERAAPDIVLVAPCGYDAERAAAEAARLLTTDSWRWLESRVVWALDANALTSRPGPRLIDGIEVMASIFAPSLFSAPRPEDARAVVA